MVTAQDILLGLLLPAGLAAILVCLTGRWLGLALGLAAGYLTGQACVDRWPDFPAPTTEQWLVYLVLLALAGELLLARWNRGVLRWLVRVVLAGTLVGLTLKPLVPYSWSLDQGVLFGGLMFLAMLLVWWAMDSEQAPWREGVQSGAWIVIAGATGLVCLLGGSQKLGQFGGALTAALAGAAMVWMWKPVRTNLARGGMQVVLLTWFGLLLNGHSYAEVPWWTAVLLGLSPLFMRFRSWLPQARLQGWRRTAVTLAMVLVPVALALIPMIVKFLQSMQENGGQDYGY
jgi:hypothetical protein